MTRSELVSAYQNGRIDRRTLIKGLCALGMSATVATAMADRLRAAPAPSSAKVSRFQDDTYDDTYDDDEDDVEELPNTGAGTGPDKNSWMAPAAAVGAAAAFIASRFRRVKSSDAE